MKKLISIFVVCLSLVILGSCAVENKALLETKSDNNDKYKVNYLFEHDGCKVYRFYDLGNYVYFTNCNGNVTSISTDSVPQRTHTITSRE